MNDTGTTVPGSSGSGAVASRIRCERPSQPAHDFRRGLLARKLAEVLFDVLNLERALLEVVLRDVIFHGEPGILYDFPPAVPAAAALWRTRRPAPRIAGGQRGRTARGKPRGSEFVFARLRYESGDWDYNPKVAANVLDSIVQYTSIPVYKDEVVISAASDELLVVSVRLHDRPQAGALQRRRTREPAALRRRRRTAVLRRLQSRRQRPLREDRSSRRCRRRFPTSRSAKLPPSHPLYRSFFTFKDGPPQTSHELNGWGDNIVHEYLKGIERRGRLAVLYSNKDYGCEWDYDWRNKRFLREDNTKFAVNIVVYVMA